MRLISQNRTIDCPYEISNVRINEMISVTVDTNTGGSKEEVDCYEINCCGYSMGKYSAKEKALRVMYELRNSWKDDLAFFFFPKDEEVEV